jgi:hypothetical protein
MFVEIPDYPNYLIDEKGCVVSKHTNAPLCVWTNDKGYSCVLLYKNNKPKRFTIHRLLGLLFIPNPDNKPFIDHINRIKTDYRLENLRWVTNSENIINSDARSNMNLKNIYWRKEKNRSDRIVVQIRRNNVMVLNKPCKTVEEAIELRDTFLKSLE